MSDKDLYQILGVPRDADLATLKQAYRKLARIHHPDHNPDDPEAEDRFREVARAWQILSDPDQRQSYDRFGHAALREDAAPRPGFRQEAPGARPEPPAPAAPPPPAEGPGVDDSLDEISWADDVPSGASGAIPRGRPEPPATRGRPVSRTTSSELGAGDIEVPVTVKLTQVALGDRVTIHYDRRARCGRCAGEGAEPDGGSRICGTCNGLGRARIGQGTLSFAQVCNACGGAGRRIERLCVACSGSGVVMARESLTVRIPPGTRHGERVRVRGRGHGGLGGDVGDLHLRFHIENDTPFEVQGDDLHLMLPITFPEALLGASIHVPTLDRPVRVKVPPGTSSGRRLRLKRRGLPGREDTGDLYITLHIVVPERFDEASAQLARRFAELNPHNPRPW